MMERLGPCRVTSLWNVDHSWWPVFNQPHVACNWWFLECNLVVSNHFSVPIKKSTYLHPIDQNGVMSLFSLARFCLNHLALPAKRQWESHTGCASTTIAKSPLIIWKSVTSRDSSSDQDYPILLNIPYPSSAASVHPLHQKLQPFFDSCSISVCSTWAPMRLERFFKNSRYAY